MMIMMSLRIHRLLTEMIFKKEYQNIYELGKRKFFQKEFIDSRIEFDRIENWGYYKDSITNFYTQNLSFAIQNGKIDWAMALAKNLNIQSDELTHIRDSIKTAKEIVAREKELQERKWVYIGNFNGVDKYGYSDEYFRPCYYDINHLLYEGDSVCIVLRTGDYKYSYQYVSLNLTTKIVHGIDASSFYGKSYNFIWDGDWWKENNEFANKLYEAIKK